MFLPSPHAAGAQRRRARLTAVLVAVALAARPAAGGRPAPAAPRADAAFVVVVHAANPSAAMPRDQVARLFLRKLKRWPSGAPAEPVDLAPGAPARDQFTRRVLGKSVATVRAYWQQRIFSGAEVPPPEKAGEADALDFVRTHPGAVTYVSGASALPPGVRPLDVTE
jgi:ABC-type phosphate transport system substrate-binding protein